MMLWKTSSPEEREIALEHYSENLYTLLSDQQEEWQGAVGRGKERIQLNINRNIEEFNRIRTLENSYPDHNMHIPLRKRSFKRFFLQNVDLSGLDCSHSDFTQSALEYANFKDASCEETSFFNANISHANFQNAKCTKANFKHTNCRATLFTQSDIERARFDSAILKKTSFHKAFCKGTAFNNTNSMNADFQSAHLISASFNSANCEFANFVSTECRGVDFKASNLRNTKMDEYTIVDDCIFHRAKLEGSELKIARKQFYTGYHLKILPEEKFAEEHSSSGDYEKHITRAQDTYRNLKKYFSSEGLHEDAGKFHIRERLMEMANLKNRKIRAKENFMGYLRHRKSNTVNDTKESGGFLNACMEALRSRNGQPLVEYFRRLKFFIRALKSKFMYYMESKLFYTYYRFLYKNGAFGEKPYFIVLLWFKVIVLYAFIYLITDIPFNTIKDASFRDNGGIDYLYFSMVTFTTLGYGDLKPLGYMRLVASSEAIVGMILIAYFVVAWARKIFR